MSFEKMFDFVNAQQMARENPETFEAPSKTELDNIKPGQPVKVSLNKERFWVLVTKVDGDNITGTIDNNLLRNNLKYGDIVTFTKDNVFAIMD